MDSVLGGRSFHSSTRTEPVKSVPLWLIFREFRHFKPCLTRKPQFFVIVTASAGVVLPKLISGKLRVKDAEKFIAHVECETMSNQTRKES